MSKIIPCFTGMHKHDYIPLPFHRLMSKPIDPRLMKLTQELGVIDGKRTKYNPIDRIPKGERITDKLGKRFFIVDRSVLDGIPRAYLKNTREMPMQLLSRWYGFAFTYPNCEIYSN